MPPKKRKFSPFSIASMAGLVTPLPPKLKALPTVVPLPGICPQGKTMFTKTDAEAVRLRIEAAGHNDGSSYGNTRRALHVYRCQFCSHYHVGHRR
jgi:hypothetical protein